MGRKDLSDGSRSVGAGMAENAAPASDANTTTGSPCEALTGARSRPTSPLEGTSREPAISRRPFLWIWAMLYRPDRGWGFKHSSATETNHSAHRTEVEELRRRVAELEKRFGDASALMELLLILTSAAVCVAIFKIFRSPANKWTLSTAVFGGIFLIGSIVLIMNYNHPFTDNPCIYFATTPIESLKCRSSPTSNSSRAMFCFASTPASTSSRSRSAALAEAEQNVARLKAALAGFQQNALQRVRPGDEAEVAFDAHPRPDIQGQSAARARRDRERAVSGRRGPLRHGRAPTGGPSRGPDPHR
jgi:hypothetical protein